MLLPIADKPLVVHTLERVRKASLINEILAAVDDELLQAPISANGFNAVLTSRAHRSGTDRIAEIAKKLPDDSIIINVQGDEPLIEPETIDLVVAALENDRNAQIATARVPIGTVEELFSPNVVKVICDAQGYAVHFSRSPIPFLREPALRSNGDLKQAVAKEPRLLRHFFRHVGIYGFRREYLLRFASLAPSSLELHESLEQLRAIEDRAIIRVVDVPSTSIGVDTETDYLRVKEIIESRLRSD